FLQIAARRRHQALEPLAPHAARRAGVAHIDRERREVLIAEALLAVRHLRARRLLVRVGVRRQRPRRILDDALTLDLPPERRETLGDRAVARVLFRREVFQRAQALRLGDQVGALLGQCLVAARHGAIPPSLRGAGNATKPRSAHRNNCGTGSTVSSEPSSLCRRARSGLIGAIARATDWIRRYSSAPLPELVNSSPARAGSPGPPARAPSAPMAQPPACRGRREASRCGRPSRAAPHPAPARRAPRPSPTARRRPSPRGRAPPRRRTWRRCHPRAAGSPPAPLPRAARTRCLPSCTDRR